MPDYGALLTMQLKALGLPAAEREYRVVPDRRWRFDFAWPAQRVALEIEGGVWIRGRHTRPSGYLKDVEKYNRAALEGWRVLRATPQDVRSGAAVQLLEKALDAR
jgi:hypothetical protein